MVARTSPSTKARTSGGAAIVGTEHGEGPGPEVMDANTLIGDSVVNDSGEDLGKIEAIMLDVTAGKVAYAVLSFGGFMGMGNKLFAIPWSAFGLCADGRFASGGTSGALTARGRFGRRGPRAFRGRGTGGGAAPARSLGEALL